jgi:hypothetical protein
MDYQTLTEVLGQSKSGATPAPSLNDIIAGIQSQYQAVPSMPVQSALYGANRYVSGTPQFGAIEVLPEYGMTSQLAGPQFMPSEFNREIYGNVDTQGLSNLISTISNDYGGDGSGNSSTGVDDAGLATSTNVSPTGVGIGALGLSLVSGLPIGLMSNLVGKQTIANAINAQSHAAAVAQNNAMVAAQMGLANTPENAAAIASAIDSLSAAPVGQTSATVGPTGTGGSAANAGAAAAAAAAAVGHSDAAIGAAAQAAADATVSGASPAAAAAAAADAANAAAADAADADGGGIGTAATGGIGGVGIGESSSAGSSGGAKIICTKLHELGLMPKSIYEADQAFGKKLVNESPETYDGYVRWAKHVVNLMGRDDLLGKTTVFCAYHIATPWSLAMAEEIGQPVKASWFGKFLMKRGLQLCKLIGSGSKQTATA